MRSGGADSPTSTPTWAPSRPGGIAALLHRAGRRRVEGDRPAAGRGPLGQRQGGLHRGGDAAVRPGVAAARQGGRRQLRRTLAHRVAALAADSEALGFKLPDYGRGSGQCRARRRPVPRRMPLHPSGRSSGSGSAPSTGRGIGRSWSAAGSRTSSAPPRSSSGSRRSVRVHPSLKGCSSRPSSAVRASSGAAPGQACPRTAMSRDMVTRSWLLAGLFQRLGYVGRCSFDLLVVGEGLATAPGGVPRNATAAGGARRAR